MKVQLEQYIGSTYELSENEEIGEILRLFREHPFEKGDCFKLCEEVSTALGFLAEGRIPHYSVNDNGDEFTIRISGKDSFIGDTISVRTQKKTRICIEFMEASSMLVANYEDLKALLTENLTLNWIILNIWRTK